MKYPRPVTFLRKRTVNVCHVLVFILWYELLLFLRNELITTSANNSTNRQLTLQYLLCADTVQCFTWTTFNPHNNLSKQL